MSAGATITPAVEISTDRRSAGRLVVVATAYLAIVLFAAIYPLVSPLRDYWSPPVSITDQAMNLVTGLLWFAVLLVSVRRNPDGRLWKLIFLSMALQRISVLTYVPNSLVFSVGRAMDEVAVAILVHLLVAFPTGYLRDRFDRVVVGLGYVLLVAWTATEVFLAGDWWRLACDPECIRNVLIVWPNDALYEWLRNAMAGVFVLLVIPLVLVALWRHWRAAGSAARRALLPLVVAAPSGS